MSILFGRVNLSPHTRLAGFAGHLHEGRLVGSRCLGCGREEFPPRADCAVCLGGEFEYREVSARGTVLSFTRIDAAPAGFEDLAPYVLGVVDLEDRGRLLAWFGDSISADDIRIGMAVRVAPREIAVAGRAHVYYTLEAPRAGSGGGSGS